MYHGIFIFSRKDFIYYHFHLCRGKSSNRFYQTAENVKKFGAPFPKLSAFIMSLLAIIGGLSVALGFYARIGAALLFIFLLPTTFIAHRFWGLGDKKQLQMQRVNFLKNLSLIGVAFMIMYFGSGPLSWR